MTGIIAVLSVLIIAFILFEIVIDELHQAYLEWLYSHNRYQVDKVSETWEALNKRD